MPRGRRTPAEDRSHRLEARRAAFPPVSKQRNRRERQIPSLCAYSLCTPCTLWWRLGRLPASCQLGSGVLVACLAGAQAWDTGIKAAGMRLQSLPVCISHPLPVPPLSLIGTLRRVSHSQTAHYDPVTSPPAPAPPSVSSFFLCELCLRVFDSGFWPPHWPLNRIYRSSMRLSCCLYLFHHRRG